MKQASDAYTRDFLDAPKPGRPRKPNALTPAERARRYRQRRRQLAADQAAAAGPVFGGLAASARARLFAADVRTNDDLADLTVQELVNIAALDPEAARATIVAARAAWFPNG